MVADEVGRWKREEEVVRITHIHVDMYSLTFI